MKSLLIVAHGSRRAASNDEVRELRDRIRERAGERYAAVEHAFLELAQPSIGEGIDACVRPGVEEVVVFPYFLAAGRHVVADIPEEVARKQPEYPDVHLRVAPYLGSAAEVAEIVLELVGPST